MQNLRYKVGDKIRTTQEVEYLIPKGTKGIVTAAYPLTHSSFPYTVQFSVEGAEKFPIAENEIEPILSWRQRLKRWWTKPPILNAEEHFSTEETVQAFLTLDELPAHTVAYKQIQ